MTNSTGDYKQELLNRQSSKVGLRGKINANCIDCVYDSTQQGSWRKQVENCCGYSCQLYAVRPISTPDKK